MSKWQRKHEAVKLIDRVSRHRSEAARKIRHARRVYDQTIAPLPPEQRTLSRREFVVLALGCQVSDYARTLPRLTRSAFFHCARQLEISATGHRLTLEQFGWRMGCGTQDYHGEAACQAEKAARIYRSAARMLRFV